MIWCRTTITIDLKNMPKAIIGVDYHRLKNELGVIRFYDTIDIADWK